MRLPYAGRLPISTAMDLPQHIERDPEWLPHRLDAGAGRLQFVRFERTATGSHGFLIPSPGQDSVWLDLAAIMAMQPEAGPAGLIFHTGFCRSTLLLRALEVAGVSATLNEPEILNSLARVAAPDPAVIRQILALLSRPVSPVP